VVEEYAPQQAALASTIGVVRNARDAYILLGVGFRLLGFMLGRWVRSFFREIKLEIVCFVLSLQKY
jgi:hypothetical protein